MERHRERSGAEKERFNEQYPDLMNKGYFTDVDDDTMRLGTFYYAGGILIVISISPYLSSWSRKRFVICIEFGVILGKICLVDASSASMHA